MFGRTKEITKEVAEVAAKWWADKICGDVKFDNGDDSMNGLFCMVMAKSLVKPVTEEQKNSFIENLAESIVKEQRDLLDVDYHPDRLLSEAAQAAGISGNNFPWKTVMWIVEDEETKEIKILVKAGYGAEQKQIYPVQDGEQE